MSSSDPRPALEALASEHGLPILRFLRGRDWTLATQVAEGLGIHTTTASKYLSAFHEAGFLERRVHASRRATHAFRLPSSVIRLELNLSEDRGEARDVAEAAEAFLDALLAAAERVGGGRLTGNLVTALFGPAEWRPTVQDRFARAEDPRGTLDALVRDTHRACSSLVGTVTAGRLLRLALEAAAEGRGDLFPALAPEASP